MWRAWLGNGKEVHSGSSDHPPAGLRPGPWGTTVKARTSALSRGFWSTARVSGPMAQTSPGMSQRHRQRHGRPPCFCASLPWEADRVAGAPWLVLRFSQRGGQAGDQRQGGE